jgi:hypothetical protein
MKKVGKSGEKTLSKWCVNVDIIATRPDEDERGWDFLLEFPLDNEQTYLKDQLATPIECKVQVKSSNQDKNSDGITISNLHTLVRNPLPVFFLFMEFDGQTDPERTYLVHLDQELASKILKRVRELTLEGKGDHLNKHEMNIQYPESTRLDCNDGRTLKLCIEQHLSMGMGAYQQDKAQWIESVGYEEGNYQVCIKHRSVSDLVDLSIGVRDELVIDHCAIHPRRFDMVSKEAESKGAGALLKIKPRARPVELIFRQDNHFSPGINFQGELYAPPMFFTLEEYSANLDSFKARLVFDDFVMIFVPQESGTTISFSLDLCKKMSLSKLEKGLRLSEMMSSRSKLFLEILFVEEDRQSVKLDFFGACIVDGFHQKIIEDLAILKSVIEICRHYSFSPEEIDISLQEMRDCANSINLLHKTVFLEDYFNFQLLSDESMIDEKLEKTELIAYGCLRSIWGVHIFFLPVCFRMNYAEGMYLVDSRHLSTPLLVDSRVNNSSQEIQVLLEKACSDLIESLHFPNAIIKDLGVLILE